ncbi:MAG: hypothetical protein ACR2J8_01605 [Thermomicrobiales bacterium]
MTDRYDHQDPGSDVPLVGRPRGESWRDLQADGVVWEGQVFIVGDGADLAARLIVTTSRVAFARGGEVVLDMPRAWLRPAPEMLKGGTVAFHVMEPDAGYGAPPETFELRMRDGATAGSHMVAMLAGTAGRRSLPDLDAMLPASRPVFPEAEPRRAPRPAAPAPRWADTAPELTPVAPSLPATPRIQVPPSPAAMVIAAEEGSGVYRLSSAPTASGPGRNWNLPMQEYVVPRSHRRPRWGWTARIGGLVGLLAVAAALGSGRISSPLEALHLGDLNPAPVPTAVTNVSGAVVPDTAVSSESAQQQPDEPSGIGGPTSSTMSSIAPSNAPVAAPLMQVAEGSTETWTEPTAAPPAPALLAPLAEATMPAASILTGVGGELPSVESIAGEVTDALSETPQPKPAVAVLPTATPMPQPTQAPAPTEAPYPTDIAVPTEAALPTPTIAPEPTATTAPEPTAVPTEIIAVQDVAPKAPTLAWNVRLATGGQSLPDFGLPPSDTGNWIVLVVDMANTGAEPVSVPMSGFRLGTTAGEATLDPSTDLAAMISGVTPQWTASDIINLQPGEATRALLLFQVDPAASGMTLLGEGLELPIADALASGGSIPSLPGAPSAP